LYPIKSNFSFAVCKSISDCVAKIKGEAEKREDKKRQRYSEMEKECSNERLKKASIQELHDGINEADLEVQKTRRLASQLDDICDSPRKKQLI